MAACKSRYDTLFAMVVSIGMDWRGGTKIDNLGSVCKKLSGYVYPTSTIY